MKLLKVTVVALGLLSVAWVLIPYCVVSALRHYIRGGSERYSAELQALRRDGLPTAPEQLQRSLPPPERNAAVEYAQITALLKQHPTFPDSLNHVLTSGEAGGLSPQHAASMRSVLAQQAELLPIIHRAAKKPECVFQHEWSKGPSMPIPYIAGMRHAGRLITAESRLMAYDGHYPEAVANEAQAFRIAAHCAADSLYIGYLAGIAIDSVAVRGMSQILHAAGPNGAVDRLIQQTIAADSPRLDLANGLKGEISSSLALDPLIRNTGLGYFTADEHGVATNVYDRFALNGPAFDREFADAASAELISCERLLYEAAALPPAQRRAAYAAALAINKERYITPETSKNLAIFLASKVAPVFTLSEDRLDSIRDRELVVQAAAAVLAFRAEHSHFPQSLSEAMSAVPRDHFQGQPLGYHRTGDGFVVFSRGADGFDPGTAPVSGNKAAYFSYP